MFSPVPLIGAANESYRCVYAGLYLPLLFHHFPSHFKDVFINLDIYCTICMTLFITLSYIKKFSDVNILSNFRTVWKIIAHCFLSHFKAVFIDLHIYRIIFMTFYSLHCLTFKNFMMPTFCQTSYDLKDCCTLKTLSMTRLLLT